MWHHHDCKTLTHVHPIAAHKVRPSALSGRRGLRVLAFALVTLGVCVFAWGLKYKLSLYDPPHSLSHKIPEAKLLSGKERTALPLIAVQRAEIPHPPLALSTVALAFLVLLATRVWFQSLWRRPALRTSRTASQDGAKWASFTRPPPSLR